MNQKSEANESGKVAEEDEETVSNCVKVQATNTMQKRYSSTMRMVPARQRVMSQREGKFYSHELNHTRLEHNNLFVAQVSALCANRKRKARDDTRVGHFIEISQAVVGET